MKRYSASRAGWQGWAVAVLLLAPSGVGAQAAPAYHPLLLDCATYRQQVASEIILESGRQRTRETTGRDGTLSVRATAPDSLLHLEAWFDTLTVWREGAGERIAPETDGVVGGRFKGLLTRAGGFTSLDRPFVPDEVAQVADVSDALEELFPPLPPIPLSPGRGWKDDFGTVISRLVDGTRGGRRVERYRLTRRNVRQETRLLPDSTEVATSREQSESGSYEWSSELGPVRWEREITIDVSVPAGGVVKQAFRTRIVQQAVTERLDASCGAPLP